MSRRRYMYDEASKSVVEIGQDWTGAERRAPVATEELTYGKLGVATDGTPIDSRKKHREYMRQNNVALVSDFPQTWAKEERARADIREGRADKAERREAIGRAMHQRGRR